LVAAVAEHWVCSLAVNMNNTDEASLYCRCLETITFSPHKMLKIQTIVHKCAAVNLPYCSTCVAVADFLLSHRDVACRNVV
jgi:hypothetical protein